MQQIAWIILDDIARVFFQGWGTDGSPIARETRVYYTTNHDTYISIEMKNLVRLKRFVFSFHYGRMLGRLVWRDSATSRVIRWAMRGSSEKNEAIGLFV